MANWCWHELLGSFFLQIKTIYNFNYPLATSHGVAFFMLERNKAMAKDNMSLLMFKVLTYLYECMVEGVAVKADNFKVENCFFGSDLKQEYLNDICKILEDKGYTKGFVTVKTWGGEVIVASYDAKITPEGFEYLQENKTMKKVYNYLKEAKGWLPIF